MKKMLLLGALLVVSGLPAEAFGQRYWNRGDSRIRRGVRSGRITREEARILRAQRRELRRDRRSYRRQYRSEWRDDDRRGWWRDDDDRRRRWRSWDSGWWRDDDRRRGNGYYRRGRGSERHPVFGVNGKRGRRW